MKKHHTDEQPSNAESADAVSASAAESADANTNPKTEGKNDDRKELIDHLQRLQAEFDNYRKRVERDAQEQKAAATDNLLKTILPIIDTFELSLHHAKDEHGVLHGEDLYQGVLLIHDQLKSLLESQGLTPVPTDGPFDPRLHEGLMTLQQEGAAKGTIINVFQQGYQRDGKVIRPAKVSVAK